MIQLLVVGAIALLASAGAALAQNKVIAGEKGLHRQSVNGAKLYDATTATVLVEQGRNNTGYNLSSSPKGAMFLGGRTLGRGSNRTQPWVSVHAKGNGACVRFENSPQLTIRRHYGEFCWDGLKPADGAGNWRVEDSWLKHIRDDAIEADHGGAHNGQVRRTFFDGVHTFISVTPGKGRAIGGRPRVEFHDNLMSLGCGLDGGKACENRAKRLKFAWARPQGSGQAFKVRGCGADVDLLFRNNVVMIETGVNIGGSNLPFFQCINLLPGSTGNTFFWLGGCNFRGLEMTKLHGACVPARFKLDPAVWSHASNDRAAWAAHVARWRAQIWSGKAPASSPPPDVADESDPAEDETAAAEDQTDAAEDETDAAEDETDSAEDGTDPGEDETDPGDVAGADPANAGGDFLVAVDLRPQQCPNRVRAGRKGNIPVVIAGTAGFDVRDLDPESVRLAGVAPKHHRTRFRDFASPHEPFVDKKDSGDCTRNGADGLEDLLMRFSNKNLVKALGPVSDGAVVFVPLTGKLEDGTQIRGEEVIVVFD
ncbi:MAG: hypothetical protein ACREJ5_07515 [Geminicoccaceae bacterium]